MTNNPTQSLFFFKLKDLKPKIFKITCRIDLMYSTRIFVVAVVDFVVKPDYSADRCLDFDYFGIVDY